MQCFELPQELRRSLEQPKLDRLRLAAYPAPGVIRHPSGTPNVLCRDVEDFRDSPQVRATRAADHSGSGPAHLNPLVLVVTRGHRVGPPYADPAQGSFRSSGSVPLESRSARYLA